MLLRSGMVMVTIRVKGSIHRARCKFAQNSRIASGTLPVVRPNPLGEPTAPLVRPNSSLGSQSCLTQSVLQARRTQKNFGVSEWRAENIR